MVEVVWRCWCLFIAFCVSHCDVCKAEMSTTLQQRPRIMRLCASNCSSCKDCLGAFPSAHAIDRQQQFESYVAKHHLQLHKMDLSLW